MSFFPNAPDTVSAVNSSTTPLLANASFTGISVDCTAIPICSITVIALADEDSSALGLQLQWSQDNTNWSDHVQSVKVFANESGIISDKVRSRYFRVVFTNGVVNQGIFRLQTLISTTLTTGTVRDLDTTVSGDDEALLTRSVLSGRNSLTTLFTDVKTDTAGNLRTSFGGAAADAFGRGRTTTPETLFNVDFEYDTQPLTMTVTNTGGGTATKTANVSSMTLNTGGTTNGDGTVLASRGYYRYEPGKSQLVIQTGVLGVQKTNVRSRIGYFDANNGVFFEMNGTDGAAVVQRTSTSGSPVDTRVLQANWNVDKCDGTGPSGFVIDFSKTQIFTIDMQWLGVGRVRFGFFDHGIPIVAHEVYNDNMITVPYMNTANLPIRWDIFNTGTAASGTTTSAICGSILSEGGQENSAALSFTANNAATPISANTRRPVLSIQLKTTFNSIVNRSQIRLRDIGILAATNPAFYELVYNGTLTGASFASVDGNSGMNFDVAATAITGGTIVDSGYCPAGSLSNRAAFLKDLLLKLPITLNAAGSTGDIITVVATGITGAASTTAALTWSEER